MGDLHSGDLLADLLAAHGVRHVFGVPGGQSMPLYDALRSGRQSIQHVIMRDERNLPYAAAAYARLTGKVGVVDATVGPGAALLPLGLAEAHNSATPLLALLSELPVGWAPMAEWGMASQGLDQLDLLSSVTKWRSRVHIQSQVNTLVRHAFLKATSGRPGPVALAIPEDIYLEEARVEADTIGLPERAGHYPAHRTVPDGASLRAAADLLMMAERPVLVAGGGVLHSGAHGRVTALAERLNMAVATTLMGKGSIAEDHPLAVGVLGPIGMRSAEEAVRAADLVFLVGYKNGQNSSFGWTVPGPHQQVIHLEMDAEQLGRFFPTSVGLAGDAAATLDALLGLLAAQPRPERLAWMAEVARMKSEWQAHIRPEITSSEAPIKPQRVVAEIAAASAPEDVLACDASFASGWGAIYYPIKRAGRRTIFPRGMAGLGFGLPAAIGAAAADPGQTVFCLAGDGGFAYSLGELAALKANGLKVVSVVLNNANWGWMEWINKLNWNKTYFDLPDLDFARVAEGLGVRGVTVRHADELGQALREAAAGEESVVIDVKSAIWETPVLPFRDALARQQQAGYMGAAAQKMGDDFTKVGR